MRAHTGPRAGPARTTSKITRFAKVCRRSLIAPHVLGVLQDIARGVTAGRTRDEEGVVRVPRRVLLWLEQRVKVPEAARARVHR